MDLLLIVVILLLVFGSGGYWVRGRYWKNNHLSYIDPF
jgi:hypothetical protein